MLVIRTIAMMQEWIHDARAHRHRVGCVPTMGALHDGHLSLVARARAECDVVVVSIFVNPTQFNNSADLTAYPRTEHADAARLQQAGVDVLFAPDTHDMYPSGFSTSVDVGQIAGPLEGESRGPAHFRGVATVVAKLFNIMQPHAAYFGQKDAQQLLVVKHMVRDLNMPVAIVACETVREGDGLALSSRNVRLHADARRQAVGLSRALFRIRDMVHGGERRTAVLHDAGTAELSRYGIPVEHVDYLAIVDADTLTTSETVHGEVLVAVAAHVGGVRLIDNVTVSVRQSGIT